jgi:hypothetical protein
MSVFLIGFIICLLMLINFCIMMVPGSNLGQETIKHVCIMKVPGSNLGQETFNHVCIMKVHGYVRLCTEFILCLC